MEQPDSFPSSSSSSSSSINREPSGAAASSSSSSSQVHEEEGFHQFNHDHHGYDRDQYRNPELDQHHIGVSYRGNSSAFDNASTVIRDNIWSCIVVVLTFWFFVSTTLILGFYGSVNLRLGPNCSILIQPNPIFVRSIKLEELDDAKHRLRLYGFCKSPPLDVVATWSEAHRVSVPVDSYKEWIHYFNEGSQINISYSVNSSSYSIFLIIAQGNEGLAQWLEDPTYPDTTLSWNLIHGSGMIQQHIYRSSSYHIAVGNLNSEEVKVKLNIRIRAFLYNTTEAYSKCTFTNGQCGLNVLFPEGNTFVLTSPGPGQNTSSGEWYVRLSYGPRWITYIVGIGGMTAFVLVAFNFFNKFRCSCVDEPVQCGEMGSERAPLLLSKDDDLSSWGSSHDSVSNDDEDLEKILRSVDGKSVRDGENDDDTRRLCAICFDAPRDCFFLPCGHCVACFQCGTRIAEAAGTCPICRRNMKKVRKIFTV